MKGQAFKPKRLTKRERKALNPMNQMVKNSLKFGEQLTVNGVDYIGAVPTFVNRSIPGMLANFIKYSKGVPFIRLGEAHAH